MRYKRFSAAEERGYRASQARVRSQARATSKRRAGMSRFRRFMGRFSRRAW